MLCINYSTFILFKAKMNHMDILIYCHSSMFINLFASYYHTSLAVLYKKNKKFDTLECWSTQDTRKGFVTFILSIS